ncbi:MAG: serine protease Do [Cocleimonas sp.]|jgi:serine protease Do
MFNMILSKYFSLPLIILLVMVSHIANAELPDFTKLVEQHSAAVVNISTKQNNKSAKKPSNLNGEQSEIFDELMKRFLDRDGGSISPERETSSLGSGFISSKDGYIVTNYHVIAQADEIIVRLSDRRELAAKLVGIDKRSDIALLKVEADDLPVLEIGSSENLKVGEWVVAIGSPFGFDHSVTAGIVSAKGRSLPSENYVPFIQTDVAINPGNSGGPLFNLKGQVVGINSQIFSRTGGFMGVSFAIPIDVAQRVVEQLKSKGKVSRGWLGIYIQEVTRDLALSFGLKKPMGALIVNVIDDGPAKGVLKQGDIVLEFDGKMIKNASALPVIVGSTSLDNDVDIKVRRGGKTEILKIRLAELPSEDQAKKLPKKKVVPKKNDVILGMELADLDDAVKKSLDVEKGVLVKSIKGEPAKSAGLESGDLIMMFKGQHIENLAELNKLSEDIVEGKTYAILILRAGSARFLALKSD